MNGIFIAVATGFAWSIPLAAIVWLSLRVTGNALNAATRYGVWWAALAVAAALPLLFLPAPPKLTLAPSGAKASALLPGFGPAFANPEPTPRIRANTPQIPISPIAVPQTEWPQRFAQLWAFASFLMLTRLAVSLIMLQIQRRKAADAPASLATLMTSCLARCGVRRRAHIAVVTKGGSPLVTGPIRPFILIPAHLLQAIDDAEMEQICLHEAAHLARFDDCALLLQRIVEALAVFHPVVRWIARQIDLEREIACDDHVIALTGDSRSYASCLTHVAELSNGYRSSPVASAAADESSHLNRRIDMLLNKTRRTGTRILKGRFIAGCVALALITWLAGKSPALLALAAPVQPAISKPAAQSAPPQPAQPQPVQTRASSPASFPAHMVSIPVTVTDPLNRYVTGLDKSSFRIYEDGMEQAISSLRAPDSNVSVTVVSNGEGDRSALDRTIAETENELAQLRRIYKDSYPDVVRLKSKLQELNADKYPRSSMNSLQGQVAVLEQELARLENDAVNLETKIASLTSELGMPESHPDGSTADRAISRNKIESEIVLSNALLLSNQHDREFRRRELEGLRREIDDAANQSSSLLNRLSAAMDNALGTPETKHAIVVEFDARDKSILWPENELHALIQRSTVRVYTIGVQTPGETPQREPNALLSLLTNATGGRQFKAAAWAEAPQIENKIEIELQNEYTATYLGSNRSASGTYHRIEVRMAPIRGLPELHAYTRPGHYTTSP